MPDPCPRCGQPEGEHDCRPDVIWTGIQAIYRGWSPFHNEASRLPDAEVRLVDSLARHMRRLLAESDDLPDDVCLYFIAAKAIREATTDRLHGWLIDFDAKNPTLPPAMLETIDGNDAGRRIRDGIEQWRIENRKSIHAESPVVGEDELADLISEALLGTNRCDMDRYVVRTLLRRHRVMGFPESPVVTRAREVDRIGQRVLDLPWQTWHWANLSIRINKAYRTIEADWLKDLAYALIALRDALPEKTDE